MSRTLRKIVDRPDRNNSTRALKIVRDGECGYKCKCSYCIKMRKKKIIEGIYNEEIKNVTKYLEV